MTSFQIGERAFRCGQPLGGTIAEVVETPGEEAIYRLVYDEGGDGWWPRFALFATEEERRDAEAPAFAAAKERKLSALAERRRLAEARGTNVAGLMLATDAASQAKLTAAVVACVLDNAYSVRWKLADGSFTLLDHASLIAAAQGVRAHVQACFDREATLAAEIAAALDDATLTAIDIESGWLG